MNQKTCLVIVDGGSSANCISVDFCLKARIPTEPHPKPHKIQWLDEGGVIKVTKQAKVLLNFGPFSYTVLCEVVPMEACHILLGRPWEFDRDAIKYCQSNRYAVKSPEGEKFTLLPLPPHEILKSQMKMHKEKQEQKNRLTKEIPSEGKKGREFGKSKSGEDEK